MSEIRLISVNDLPRGHDAADLSSQDIVSRVEEALEGNPLIDKFASFEEFETYLEGDSHASTTTHFKNIDAVAPFPATGVVVLAGRPGHGKSSLMRNIALKKALNGDMVVYISYEFSQQKEILNFISTYEGHSVDPKDARFSEGYKKLKPLLKRNLLITHKIKSIEEIQSLLSSEDLRGATIFLDYLQKIPSTSVKGEVTGSEAQIRHVCNALNDLAVSYDYLVVAGSQLTQSNNMPPTMDVVKGARAIEEVASVLLRIWRHKINESSMLHDMAFSKGDYNFTLDVLKNREAPSGGRIGLYTVGGLKLVDALGDK